VLQPVHAFRIGLLGGTEVDTPREAAPVSYGIRRCEFDHYLLERSGARKRLGEPLDTLVRTPEGWLVNGRIRARLLVGAGGHFCPVAARLGPRAAGPQRAVVAQEVEFEMSASQRRGCRVAPDVPQLFFCDDLAGYGWVFRKGDWLNVGLGREDPRGLARHVGAFVSRMVDEGRIPASTPREVRGHAYLLYGHAPRRMVDDGVLLVGDAAGLAYPESGEGIRPAVESSLLAASVIARASGDYGAPALRRYDGLVRRRFGPRRPSAQAEGGAAARLRRFAGRALLGSPWFARRVVLDRWFLHREQSALGSAPR
jgi:flavin-dependent dehydrogenase